MCIKAISLRGSSRDFRERNLGKINLVKDKTKAPGCLSNLWIHDAPARVARLLYSKVGDYTRQKEKGKRQKAYSLFTFCLLPFSFCLILIHFLVN
ncbi:MAG: hypothetical protein DMF68_20140 [Acidobacteria bacterium]|nr:MAG: hypothetical protein DMF68_20140 [Acidobacteriota bacterium]